VASNKKPRDRASSARPRIKSSHGAPVPKRARSAEGAATPGAELPRPARAPKPPKKTRHVPASVVGGSTASEESRELAIAIAIAALEKKAVGLEVLDVAGKVDYADFLVLMTGRSDRHVVALSQAIEDALRKRAKRPLSVEGLPHASWVLMDFGDVVVHVFQDEARSLYDIEGLWMDARRIPVPPAEREDAPC
jgi:ribosome-associated protein